MISDELMEFMYGGMQSHGIGDEPPVRFLLIEDKYREISRVDEVIELDDDGVYAPVEGVCDYMVGKSSFAVGDEQGHSYFSVGAIPADDDQHIPLDLETTIVAMWQRDDKSIVAFAFCGCSVYDYEFSLFRGYATSSWIKIVFDRDKLLT